MKQFLVAAALAALSLPALAGRVTLTTADGARIIADHNGAGERGVVLLHPHQGNRGEWGALDKVLADQGGQTLRIDLRGHGESTGQPDATKMAADVDAAIAYLRKKGATRVTLIGAGLGGNLAFQAAARDAAVHDVVMLSPRLDAQGVKVSTALGGFGRRPLLLVVGSDDQLSNKAADMIARQIDSTTVEALVTPGSGMRLLNRDSSLQGILVSWFNGAYQVANGVSSHDLATDQGSDLKTTGTKLGER